MFAWLALSVALGAAGVDDSLKAVEKDFNQLLDKVRAKVGVRPDEMTPLIDRCLDLADEAEAAAAEYAALEWALRIANFRFAPTYQRHEDLEGAYADVLDRIIDRFVDDPRLGQLVLTLAEEDRAALDRIAAETATPAIKAALWFRDLSNRMDQVRFGNLAPAKQKELGVEFRALIEEYGTIADPLGRGTYGELVRRNLFELEHLSVGCIAPDIEGEDLDGETFKLSDYRGKVILLDFWGHW